jgi:D-amino-acid oxidase
MHITEAAELHHSGMKADVVVNCTGLSSSTLGGVEDKNVIPARGQIIVVRNSPGKIVMISGTDDGEDEATYIIERAAGSSPIPSGDGSTFVLI